MSLYWWGPDFRWKGQFWGVFWPSEKHWNCLQLRKQQTGSFNRQLSIHQMTSLHARTCLFLVALLIIPHIQKSNFHIMKTTAPIASKFCLTIKNNMYCWWVVPIHIQQMQDGDKLQHLHNAFIDVNEICHGNSYWGCILAPPGDYD